MASSSHFDFSRFQHQGDEFNLPVTGRLATTKIDLSGDVKIAAGLTGTVVTTNVRLPLRFSRMTHTVLNNGDLHHIEAVFRDHSKCNINGTDMGITRYTIKMARLDHGPDDSVWDIILEYGDGLQMYVAKRTMDFIIDWASNKSPGPLFICTLGPAVNTLRDTGELPPAAVNHQLKLHTNVYITKTVHGDPKSKEDPSTTTTTLHYFPLDQVLMAVSYHCCGLQSCKCTHDVTIEISQRKPNGSVYCVVPLSRVNADDVPKLP